MSYVRYYNVWRTHRALDKDAPVHRVTKSLGAIMSRPSWAGFTTLYNLAARNKDIAKALCAATKAVDRNLIFFALAGSDMVTAAGEAKLTVAQEVYADRTYQDDGSLTPRSDPRAMITDVDVSIRQVLEMLRTGTVRSLNGVAVKVEPDTLCIHGDQPGALKRDDFRLIRLGIPESGLF
jgi:lactam utilization protein B